MNFTGRAIGLMSLIALSAGFLALSGLPVAAFASSQPGTSTDDAGFSGSAFGETHLVAGLGSTTLGEGFPEDFAGDSVRVTLGAVTFPSSEAAGMFRIVHRNPDGSLVAELRGTLNCLDVEGDYAKVTGVITFADVPAFPTNAPQVGYVAGFVIADSVNGDSMAWAWDETGAPCHELPAITVAEVEHGGFVVR